MWTDYYGVGDARKGDLLGVESSSNVWWWYGRSPPQPPRRLCICQCRYTQTLPELLDDIRWGDIRIPQLCHYLFGTQEKHTSCASKAKARARARARAQGGGSAKRNKALKVKN